MYVVATPIGNLEDITVRALRILRDEVAVIACEDTRQSQTLLQHYGIRKKLVSYHEHNEAARSESMLQILEGGDSVALISDAGTPLLSDPGFRMVSAAVEAGYNVVPIPGASAALAALAVSGLPTDEFRFIGFLPSKQTARKRTLESLQNEASTVIAYESPHRVIDSLGDLAEIMPARRIVLARELTKLHEELLRGTAEQIRDEIAARPAVKGEITLVIGGSEEREEIGDPATEVQRLELEGLDRMSAIKTVAKRTGLPKREVYRLAEEAGNNRLDKGRD